MEEYTNNTLNAYSKIKGKCNNNNCNEIFVKNYINMIKSKNTFCRKCSYILSKEKTKKTCLEKYGVDNPLQNEEIKEKIKNTCKEKYGVDNPLKNKEVRNKIKNTMIEKYGVENPSQNQEIKNKKIKTSLENWGVEQPLSSKIIKEKSKKTICVWNWKK